MILHQNNSTQVVNCGINQSTDIVSTSNKCLFTIITQSPRCSANTGRSSAPSQVSRHQDHQSTWQCQQQAGSTQLPACCRGLQLLHLGGAYYPASLAWGL